MSAVKHSLKAFPILLDTSKFHIVMLDIISQSWLSQNDFKTVKEYMGGFAAEQLIKSSVWFLTHCPYENVDYNRSDLIAWMCVTWTFP